MRKLRITIDNKSYDVTVEDLTESVQHHVADSAATMFNSTAKPPQPSLVATPHASPSMPIDTGSVTSPMAGVIKSILVKTNDEVKSGQPLVVLEAMKMENQITAPVSGMVTSIAVSEGDSVQEGNVLLVLE